MAWRRYQGMLADYVFLIRVVSICDGCPFYSYQPLMAYVMFASCELSLHVCCLLTAWGAAHPPSCCPQPHTTGVCWASGKQENAFVSKKTLNTQSVECFFFCCWKSWRSTVRTASNDNTGSLQFIPFTKVAKLVVCDLDIRGCFPPFVFSAFDSCSIS